MSQRYRKRMRQRRARAELWLCIGMLLLIALGEALPLLVVCLVVWLVS